VRLNAGALPVRPSDGIDRPSERDGEDESEGPEIEPSAGLRMSTSPGSLPNDGPAFEVFQVVGELLRRGERTPAGENENRRRKDET